MKRILLTAAVLSILALVPAVRAQERGAVTVAQTEAVIKVIKIDRKARTVTFQGPRGNTQTLNVPKEAQNFDQVKVGSLFRVKYVEAVAVALGRGGQAAVTTDQQVRLAPKGGTPGGVVVNTARISAKVEAIDYASREVAVRGPKGNLRAFKVSEDVQGLAQVNIGDTISVTYAEALALEMVEAPGPKAKPSPK